MKSNYRLIPVIAVCLVTGCTILPKTEKPSIDQRLMSDEDLAKVHSMYSSEVPNDVYQSIQRQSERLSSADDIGKMLQDASSFNVIRGELTPEMIDLLKGFNGYSRLHVIKIPFENGVPPIYIIAPVIKSK